MARANAVTVARTRRIAAPPSRVVAALSEAHEAWDSANADFAARLYLRLNLTVRPDDRRIVLVTRTWLAAYRSLNMSVSERACVESAAANLAASSSPHPRLGATRLRMEPLGAMICTPTPGLHLTWRTHTELREPVMLTLSRI